VSGTLGGLFRIGGSLPVHRLGFGSMQLAGPGVWGPPKDEQEARAVLRRAISLGVDFIDTADVYGPDVCEQLIRDALSPYPKNLCIGTKVGLVRSGPATRENPGISMNASEAHIRKGVERSLRNLGIEHIDLYQLHRIDPSRPIEDTMGIFKSLRDEGKIRHIGLSEVSVRDIERARSVVEISTVQNVYNLVTRKHDDVLAYCEKHKIGFIAFWPLHSGGLLKSDTVARIATRTGATAAQIALAWLLMKSPAILLIPGTSSLDHLEQNLDAGHVVLSEEDMAILDRLGAPAPG
jgi:pyridoxine 4-dehydrogenase